MRRVRSLWVLLFLAGVVRAQYSASEISGSRAAASLEGGVESAQRRYFRPRLRFEFPLRFTRVFTDLDFYHRTNGDLEGEIDFWLDLGLNSRLASNWEMEVILRHFCRHKTSRDYPKVLDINELLARAWYVSGGPSVGLGAGTYLGTSNHYSGLLVMNLAWPRIFRSELSAAAEVKWVDFKELIYDFELAIALDPSVDLVARLTRHYVYPTTSYFGLRFNSRDSEEKHVDQFRFRAGWLPDDEARKVAALVEFNLSFFKAAGSQLVLNLEGDIPIERGSAFLGPFRPEEIRYTAGLAYEKRLAAELSAFAYGRYDLRMPVDVAQGFESSLGVGLGLRNQTYFKKLERNFRYLIFAGRNYSHGHDLGAAIGVNTTGKPINIGGDVRLDFRSGQSQGLYEIFVEAGSGPKIRPFFAFERRNAQTADKSIRRFVLGVELYMWH